MAASAEAIGTQRKRRALQVKLAAIVMEENTSREPPVPEDLRFQHRVWAAERIGWAVLLIVVIAALLGGFSSGLLSNASVATPDRALEVDYERFARKTARSHFTIQVRRSAQETRLQLSPDFIAFYDIEVLYPQPLRSTAGASGLDLLFASTAAGDLAVHLAARARRFGVASIAVSVDGLGSVEFRQVVYP